MLRTSPANSRQFWKNEMELEYEITSEQTSVRVAEQLEREIQRSAQQMQRVAEWQLRWLSQLFLGLLVAATVIAVAVNCIGAHTPIAGKIISSCISCVIVIALWWGFSGKLLGHLRVQITTPRTFNKILRNANVRVRASSLRRAFSREEGMYRLSFDQQGFILVCPNRMMDHVTWDQIVSLKQTSHFYEVTCKQSQRGGKPYLIPTASDTADALQYQQGLELFLQKCPIASSQTPGI